MESQNKSPALAGGPGFQLNLQLAGQQFTKRPKKIQRVLEGFYVGNSYNRFQAERELHDHCLHSTVARIQSMGVIILRREETVPGFGGAPTRVMRYWLAPASRERAAELLGVTAEASHHAG